MKSHKYSFEKKGRKIYLTFSSQENVVVQQQQEGRF